MTTDLLGALLLGSALTMICALMGAMIGSAIRSATRFHPSPVRRWVRRLALVAVATVPAMLVGLVLPSPTIATSAALLAVSLTGFGMSYRFASGRRMLRALDSGIAVGLH